MTRVGPRRRRLSTRFFLLLLIPWSVTACSTPRGEFGAVEEDDRRSPDEITREEITAIPESDAYEIVRVLRPRWLRSRNRTTTGAIYAEVFQDDLPFGPLASLRAFDVSQIDRLEFISSLDATTRYGTGYLGGIIRVITRR